MSELDARHTLPQCASTFFGDRRHALKSACTRVPPQPTMQVRGGRSAGRGGGVGMTPGRSPAYGLLASPHPSRGPQQPVLASPGRQGGFGGGPGGGPPGSGVYSGRITTQQVRAWLGRVFAGMLTD